MEVPMELSRIVIDTSSGSSQKIFLRERGGQGRTFQIVIGLAEAFAIKRRREGKSFRRPLTHELLASVIESLGGRLERIVIGEIRYDVEDGWGTFIATLHIRQDNRVVEVDSRPSDAIALGAAFDTPIFVAENVLEQVREGRDRIEILRQRLAVLAEQINHLSQQLEDAEFLANSTPETLREHRRQLATMKYEYEEIDRALREIE